MLTALDASPDSLDEHETDFVAKIREHGWFRTSVFGDDQGPGFSYTTGFWNGSGSPEFIVFSLKPEIAHNVLWDLFNSLKTGENFPIGQRLSSVFGNTEAFLMPVEKRRYPDYLGWNLWFYAGDDFPCVQIVWPDTKGVFPWEAGYEDRFSALQPDLTESGWLASLA